MSSQSTALALAQKKVESERAVVKIRLELKRLGCQHDKIICEVDDIRIRLTFGELALYVHSSAQLILKLKEIKKPNNTQELWGIICQTQLDDEKYSHDCLQLFVLGTFVVLTFSAIILLIR